jgi:imidazolonepropionase-like amidohydrolase
MHVIRTLGAALFTAPLLAAVLLAAMPLDAAAAGSGAVHDLVIHAGLLLDGVSDTPRRQISILVRDDKIESVQAGWVDPPGAEVVDLSTATVMPGFIDCHVHISAMLPSRVNATEYWLTHTAVKSGVKIAYGTDLGEGDHTLEFSLMIDNGLAPLQALYAATRNAAELIGAQSVIGSVERGRYADLVATAKSPIEDPDQFRHVVFVMKGGIVYRKDGVPTAAGAE